MRGLIFNLLLGTCRLCIRLARHVSAGDCAAGERRACAMAAQEHARQTAAAAPAVPPAPDTIACVIDGCEHAATTLVRGCDGKQLPLCAFDLWLLRHQMRRRIAAGEQIHLDDLREEVAHLQAAYDVAEWN